MPRDTASPTPQLTSESVTFRLAQEGDEAYVLVKAREDRPWQLCHMTLAAPGHWEVALRLRAGVYYYRFYVQVTGTTVLVPGWEGGPGGAAKGWDAVLSVQHRLGKARAADGQFNWPTGGAQWLPE